VVLSATGFCWVNQMKDVEVCGMRSSYKVMVMNIEHFDNIKSGPAQDRRALVKALMKFCLT
jgi:hypothetical protein